MALRLSSQSPLEAFLKDQLISNQQKIDCLKILKVIFKNLLDPSKNQELKYRQLRLQNEKIQTKLACHDAAIQVLKSIGFEKLIGNNNETNDPMLQIPLTTTLNLVAIQNTSTQIQDALHQLQPLVSERNDFLSACTSNKKPRIGNIITTKLSEKQKARMLREQKELQEKEAAKMIRKHNIAMLEQDKYVRENDDNWKSGVSAAAGKSGSSISTFRDKYGE